MEQKANDRQVGGAHYKALIQHWDLAAIYEWGYFQGRAIAYLMRWKEKGGIQDLEKAGHFVQKYIEVEKAKAAGTLTRDILMAAIAELDAREETAKDEFVKAQRMISAVAEAERTEVRNVKHDGRDGPDYEKDADPRKAPPAAGRGW